MKINGCFFILEKPQFSKRDSFSGSGMLKGNLFEEKCYRERMSEHLSCFLML